MSKRELCDEARHLTTRVVELLPQEPEVRGLLALMELQSSRAQTRADASGAIVLLEDQDRSAWDRSLIEQGRARLAQAVGLGRLGPYQVEACVAAEHASAASFAETNWRAIAGLYAELERFTRSPVVALNRIAASSFVASPSAKEDALVQLDELVREEPILGGYHFAAATRADILRRLGRWDEAVVAYEQAAALATNDAERAFLAMRVRQCRDAAPALPLN